MRYIITEQQYNKLVSPVKKKYQGCNVTYPPLLRQAQDFWIEWLSDVDTRQRFIKAWSHKKYDINKANQIFQKYIEVINRIKLVYYNDSNKEIDGIDLSQSRNSFCFVARNIPDKIYVNCSLDNKDKLGTLIHEIQHILYNQVHPLNPDKKIEKLFGKTNTSPIDYLKNIFNNLVDSNSISNQELINIERVSSQYGVDENIILKRFEWVKNFEENKPGYICSMNEKMSNIMSIRNLLGIKSGQNITSEMIKPYIQGKKHHTDVNWLIDCWMLRGFPDINNLISHMNDLAAEYSKNQGDIRPS